jgi:protein-tyrosine phosphatase
MAEAIFRHQVKEAGLSGRIQTDSAGTGDWHIGKPPHQGTRKLLQQKQIDCSGLTARQVVEDDFASFDYIIVMDESNLTDMRRLVPTGSGAAATIKKMLGYHPDLPGKDVPDPYYTGNFNEVYDMLSVSCRELLAEIISKHFQANIGK